MEVSNPDDATVHEPPLEPIDPEPEYVPRPDTERFAPPSSKEPGGKRRGGHKKLVLAILGVVLLAGGAAAYWFVGTHHPARKIVTTKNMPAPAPAGTMPSGTTTYTAKGQDLNLSFDYPSSWAVAPPSGSDTSDQPITVTSPLVSLTTADGQTVTGRVVVSLRPASADISELAANNPVAAQDSNQFAYTAPTPSQHQYPYLTYVHFTNGSKAPGAFEEVFITGVNSFQKGNPFDSPATDPVISASFYECNTQACDAGGRQLLSITNSTWQNSDPAKQTQSILSSLKFN